MNAPGRGEQSIQSKRRIRASLKSRLQVTCLAKRRKLTEQSQTVKIQRFPSQLLWGNYLFAGNCRKILDRRVTEANRRLKSTSGLMDQIGLSDSPNRPLAATD
jgi:hypothetical protein